jgi:hypothetical protein
MLLRIDRHRKNEIQPAASVWRFPKTVWPPSRMRYRANHAGNHLQLELANT